MSTPLSVLKDAENAERLWKEQFEKSEDGKEPGDAQPKDKPTGDKPEDKAPDNDNAQSKEGADKASTEDAQEDWEHKYKVLQGKYNAEIAGVNQRISEKDTALQNVLAKVAVLENEIKKVKPDATLQAQSEILDSFEQDPEVVNLKEQYPEIYKGVSASIKKVTEKIQQDLATVKTHVDQVADVAVKSERERFYSTLDSTVKDWKDVNRSSEWINWLAQVDPLSGLTRQQLIDNAYERKDAMRVATFFDMFKGEHSPPPQQPRDKEKVVTDKVAPPKSTGTKPPPDPDQNQKQFIPVSEINKFYMDVQRGRYIGMEDEKRKQEARIEKAVAEGRVR